MRASARLASGNQREGARFDERRYFGHPPAGFGLRSTPSWSPVASMTTARVGLAAVAAPSGVIYAIGGKSAGLTVLDSVEAYDPKTDTWAPAGRLRAPRAFAAGAFADGHIYVIGGITTPDVTSVTALVEAYLP